MGNLIKLIIVVALIAGGIFAVVKMQSDATEKMTEDAAKGDPAVRVEEKYGFTTETGGG